MSAPTTADVILPARSTAAAMTWLNSARLRPGPTLDGSITTPGAMILVVTANNHCSFSAAVPPPHPLAQRQSIESAPGIAAGDTIAVATVPTLAKSPPNPHGATLAAAASARPLVKALRAVPKSIREVVLKLEPSGIPAPGHQLVMSVTTADGTATRLPADPAGLWASSPPADPSTATTAWSAFIAPTTLHDALAPAAALAAAPPIRPDRFLHGGVTLRVTGQGIEVAANTLHEIMVRPIPNSSMSISRGPAAHPDQGCIIPAHGALAAVKAMARGGRDTPVKLELGRHQADSGPVSWWRISSSIRSPRAPISFDWSATGPALDAIDAPLATTAMGDTPPPLRARLDPSVWADRLRSIIEALDTPHVDVRLRLRPTGSDITGTARRHSQPAASRPSRSMTLPLMCGDVRSERTAYIYAPGLLHALDALGRGHDATLHLVDPPHTNTSQHTPRQPIVLDRADGSMRALLAESPPPRV